MSRSLSAFLLGCALTFLTKWIPPDWLSGWTTSQGEAVAAQLTGVTDGDTITVRMGGNVVKVRLNGIDAPEKSQPYGVAAKTKLAALTLGRRITLRGAEKDRYGRTLARVYADGDDVCLAMIRAGYAWHYTRYSNDAGLAAAEREARASKRGLWADKSPVPPWEFRNGNRLAKVTP